ncbi:MAG: phosphotransferase [Syntrophorhabdus sp.]
MKRLDEIHSYACLALKLDDPGKTAIQPLSARGSDRVFYRLSWDERSVIVIDYDPARIENTYYADIARFLKNMRIPVPEVLTHDPGKTFMILEDLGDCDLDSFSGHAWPQRRPLYQKALSSIRRLHAIAPQNVPDTLTVMEGFTPDLYLFEHNYFIDYFVKGYCDIVPEPSFEANLRSELAGFAQRLDTVEKCFIHRDLQSQNIMIHNGDPYFIDFQGMRLGNPFYDLGSLLCDPYTSIRPDDREELLSFYYVLSSQEIDWDLFQSNFWGASVQRLMQALGAYGFLGKVKKLGTFLEYIPSGLDNLYLATSHVPSLTVLKDLIILCKFRVENG